MCSLETNATADEGFAKIGRSEKASKYERTLAELAQADSVAQAQGMEHRLDPVLSFLQEAATRELTSQPEPAILSEALMLSPDLMERAFGEGDPTMRRALHQDIVRQLMDRYKAANQPIPIPTELDRLAGVELSNAESKYWQDKQG